MVRMNSLVKVFALVATVAFVATAAAPARHDHSEPGLAAFLSAVNSIPDEIKTLNAEENVTAHDIHLISVQKLTNPGNAAAIAKAIGRNAAQIAALREALRNNQTVLRVLAAEGVPVDQVVAIDVQAASAIHIFYQPGS